MQPGTIVLNVGTFDDPTVAKPGRETLKAAAIYNEPGEGGTAEEWGINPMRLLSPRMKLSEAV
jgi:hypothetical protein